MKKILSILIVSILMGCGASSSSEVISADVERSIEQVAGLEPGLNKADLSIEGMTCEIMCGGAIKKALAEIDGVSETEIVFDAETELDHAIVTYYSDEVSDTELVAAVAGIHDGIYSVRKVHVQESISGTSSSSPTSSIPENAVNGTKAPLNLQMPNLLEILFRIVKV